MTNRQYDTPGHASEPAQIIRRLAASIKMGGFMADVDEELAPLFVEMWKAGILTTFSCQEIPGIAWIQFFSVDDLIHFLNIVGGPTAAEGDNLYWRIIQNADGDSGSWEYDVYLEDNAASDEADLADFTYTPSVRFPRTDLPVLLRRMTLHNAALHERQERQ